MAADEQVERAIQALLDGRPLTSQTDGAAITGPLHEPLAVVDAIARAHRTALFGSDRALDRPAAAGWGHLEVRDEIGRGASGTVYRAWDTKLAREGALKLLTADGATAPDALAEGRLLARLRHPHIVDVFGLDEHDGVNGIWMELLDGETLDAMLARDGPFGVEEALLV